MRLPAAFTPEATALLNYCTLRVTLTELFAPVT